MAKKKKVGISFDIRKLKNKYQLYTRVIYNKNSTKFVLPSSWDKKADIKNLRSLEDEYKVKIKNSVRLIERLNSDFSIKGFGKIYDILYSDLGDFVNEVAYRFCIDKIGDIVSYNVMIQVVMREVLGRYGKPDILTVLNKLEKVGGKKIKIDKETSLLVYAATCFAKFSENNSNVLIDILQDNSSLDGFQDFLSKNQIELGREFGFDETSNFSSKDATQYLNKFIEKQAYTNTKISDYLAYEWE